MINFGAYSIIEDEHSRVTYHQHFFSNEESVALFSRLLEEIQFQPDTLKIFGKTITTQRLYAWHGDKPFDYAYSGQSRLALAWTPSLLKIKKTLEEHLKESFNCCLLNYYGDGSQGMAWHSDDEKVMAENGAIASISLGADRIFEFKQKAGDERKKVLLQNGSLLLMQGETQKHYLHQLPKSKKVKTARLNLTFRRFV
jgi:alkylated DNA repair dioxygenase AlkB